MHHDIIDGASRGKPPQLRLRAPRRYRVWANPIVRRSADRAGSGRALRRQPIARPGEAAGRGKRSPAGSARDDCLPSNAIVRRRLPGRLLLGESSRPLNPVIRLQQAPLWSGQLSHEPACWTRSCSKRLISADGWTRHDAEKHAHAEYSGGPRDAKGGGAVNAARSMLGRPRRSTPAHAFDGHIEPNDVRIAPPSAKLQRTRLMRRHRRADSVRRHKSR